VMSHPIGPGCWWTGALSWCNCSEATDEELDAVPAGDYPEMQPLLAKTLREHRKIFGPIPTDPAKVPSMTVPIEAGVKPVNMGYKRLPPALEKQVTKELQRLMKLGIIERVKDSEWGNPLALGTKPDGSMRMCINPMFLNKLVGLDTYQMPSVKILLDRTFGRKVFSALDLTSGFHQIAVDEKCRDLFTFNTPEGKCRYIRMPMGYKNAPQVFQRIMERILQPATEAGYAQVYIDDILIMSSTPQEHLTHLTHVFKLLDDANMRVNLKKSKFFLKSISYLGQIVDGASVRVDPDRLKGLRNMKIPNNVFELRSFLGLAQYYHDYVSDLSAVTAPLHALTHVSSVRKWTAEHTKAFNHIKTSILEAAPLALPDYSKPYLLRTDASDLAIGAVLSQADETGKQRPIAFISRKLTPAELKYNTTEKECLGIVHAVTKLHYYLYGSQFTVQTDHRNLAFMAASDNRRVQRWAQALAMYHFRIEHIPGVANAVADALSRVGFNTGVANNATKAEKKIDPTAPAPTSDETVNAVTRASTKQPPQTEVKPTQTEVKPTLTEVKHPVTPITAKATATDAAPKHIQTLPSKLIDIIHRAQQHLHFKEE
jgi:hypothetical protein